MGILSINDLEPGLTLQSDVRDRSGRVLLRAGAIIDPKHLKIFKAWGVTEVTVIETDEGNGPEASQNPLEKIDSTLLEAATRRAGELFFHCDCSHPAINALYNQTVLRLAMRKG